MGLDAMLKNAKRMMCYSFLSLSLIVGCAQPQIRPREPPSEQTLACSLSVLERKIGAVDDDHRRIHVLVTNVCERVQQAGVLKTIYTLEDQVLVFKTIHEILQKEGLEIALQKGPFYQSLRANRIGARDLSLLYLAIGQKLQLPLHLGLTLDHPFIMWKESASQVVWETTQGKQGIIEEYKKSIPKSILDTGLYLQPLTKKQEYAYTYAEGSRLLLERGDLRSALTTGRTAVLLESRLVSASVTCVHAYLRTHEFKTAFNEAHALVHSFPDLADSYVVRARVYLAQGNTFAALQDCEKAIQLNPNLAEAYRLRVQTLKRTARHPRFLLTEIGHAIELDPTEPEGYFIRGSLREQTNDANDVQGAKEDFDKYQELRKLQGLEP